MPFGLKNAPALFQRAIEVVLKPCSPFAIAYIDDLVIFSDNWNEHIGHLRSVFTEPRRHGLTAKSSRCVFGKQHIEYLGHFLRQVGCSAAQSGGIGWLHKTKDGQGHEIISWVPCYITGSL